MTTTIEFLDLLKAAYHLDSDYKVAKLIGMTTSSVSAYRKKGVTFDDETACRVGTLLNLDPAFVVACMHAERAKSATTKRLWEDLAAHLRRARRKAGSGAQSVAGFVSGMPIS